METSTVVGFFATALALAIFLGVSWRQLVRVRKVASGELSLGTPGTRAASHDAGRDDASGDGAATDEPADDEHDA